MKRVRTAVTTKGQTTIPKPVRDALGVEPHDSVYWEIADGQVRVTADEPEFFRWFGAIRVGPGSVSRDLTEARRKRGRI